VLFLSLAWRCNLTITNSVSGQLFTYYIENLLVIISTNSGSSGQWIMVIRLDIEIWVIGKGDTTKGRVGKGWEVMVDAGFCSPCTCLGVFLL
jgi:hypothetical protein